MVTMTKTMETEAIVIGGGQSGLATARELKQRGISAVVLEAGGRVGESWRRRWDSLRLFTPNRFNGLPGMPFPGPAGEFPTKDEMAAYLERYAREAGLDVRTGARVTRLSRDSDDAYTVETTAGTYQAGQVVIATGYTRPRIPAFAGELAPTTTQLTSYDYRDPTQLTGDVLVVGAATSGLEIAIDAARAGHRTVLAGRAVAQVPPPMYAFGGRIFWFFANRIATRRTPIGRRIAARAEGHGNPLIRTTYADATAAGVTRAARITRIENGTPIDETGRRQRADTVVWCTGFEIAYPWLDLPIQKEHGLPVQEEGAATGQPGLYFVGLPFQTRLASHFVGGVGEDAAQVARAIAGSRGRALAAARTGGSGGEPGRSRGFEG